MKRLRDDIDMGLTAAIGDVPYNVVLLAHLIFVVLGGGVAFVGPSLIKKARRVGGRSSEDLITESINQIVFPSLLLAGVAGGALVGMSDDAWDFEQGWLVAAGILWIASLVLSLVAYPPRWLNIFNADEARRRMTRGMLHLVLILMLIDMVWKTKLF